MPIYILQMLLHASILRLTFIAEREATDKLEGNDSADGEATDKLEGNDSSSESSSSGASAAGCL